MKQLADGYSFKQQLEQHHAVPSSGRVLTSQTLLSLSRQQITRIALGLAALLFVIAVVQARHVNQQPVSQLLLSPVSRTATNQAADETAPQAQNAEGNTSEGTATNTSSSSSTVTVNGQTVNVSGNGSYHKTTTNGDSQTSIDINNSSNGSTNDSSSSVSVHN